MKFSFLSGLSALLAALFALPGQAAVTLQGTRIVHDAAKGRDVTVKASNVGEQPAMTQVWIDDGDSHTTGRVAVPRSTVRGTESRVPQAQRGHGWRRPPYQSNQGNGRPSSPRIGSQATADGANHDPLEFANATRLHPSIPAA